MSKKAGLIAPASSITPAEHIKCVKALEKLGFAVTEGESLKQDENKYGYLAGEARRRAKDVNDMFADPQVEAIFCTRGGYGSMELLEYLDYELIAANPKVFVGYSDITSLHTAFAKYCGFVIFHGPMVKPNFLPMLGDGSEIGNGEKMEPGKEEELKYMLESLYTAWNFWEKNRDATSYGIGERHEKQRRKGMTFQNPPGEEIKLLNKGRNKAGCVEGRLFGGNLSVLAKLLGTAFSPVGNGEILFLEDIGESVSRIHMCLEQMKLAGMFQGVRGILLGDFTDCTNEKYDNSLAVQQFLQEWMEPLGIPVLCNVCSDHRNPMGTLPLGAVCRVEGEKISFLTI